MSTILGSSLHLFGSDFHIPRGRLERIEKPCWQSLGNLLMEDVSPVVGKEILRILAGEYLAKNFPLDLQHVDTKKKQNMD